MQKTKLTAASIVLALVLSGAALAITLLKTLNNTMYVAGIKAIRIEKPEGTPIESYDWGSFSAIGQAKTEMFWVRNIGNGPLPTLNASCTDLPFGWSLTLNPHEWVNVAVDASVNFSATLTLQEALPQGNYAFTVVFETGP